MKFFWYSMLFILSEPSIYACESTKENGNNVEGGNYRKRVSPKKGQDKCNLTQPIAFQTWSDFKHQCGKSEDIMKNPTTQVQVNLGLTPTLLLSVDSEKHVRKMS